MNIHNILQIARYEMKMVSRQWVFRLFALLSLSGIVACHVYWQGWDFQSWKMVSLPCTMPLVNAYLFCAFQSLFLVVLVADRPSREKRYNAMVSLESRPWGNCEYQWGKMLGMLALFLVVNLVVIVASIFLVNLTSFAPFSLGYYLFYMLTLTLPSFVFLYGLGLWLGRLTGSRFTVLLSLEGLVILSLAWFPYHFHGTWDFTGSGIPNLFSSFTGHVNGWNYLLHRLFYLLSGLGFFCWSVRLVGRKFNSLAGVRRHVFAGGVLLFAGMSCVFLLEGGYRLTRQAREDARESFRRHWNEETCRVTENDVTFRQSGKKISVSCDLTLHNPNEARLSRCVLFLNPGLELRALKEGGQEVDHDRDCQVLVIHRALEAGDSVRLRLEYGGHVDDRYASLHLPDTRHEDSFRGDAFFPTGRRSAFVGDDYLLLTPASLWYPVAYPPVNPVEPLASGRDFTLFRLNVVGPRQKVVVSQGHRGTRGDTVEFRPHRALPGLSLCAANFRVQRENFRSLEAVFCSGGGYQRLLDLFPARVTGNDILRSEEIAFKMTHQNSVRADNNQAVPEFAGIVEKSAGMDWYDPDEPRLYLLESPVSYYPGDHMARVLPGQDEPGLSFWPEGGFGLNLLSKMKHPEEDPEERCLQLLRVLHGIGETRCSHPLWGLVRAKKGDPDANYGIRPCVLARKTRVHAVEYPFIDRMLAYWEETKERYSMGDLLAGVTVREDELSERGYWNGRTFGEFTRDRELSPREMWERFNIAGDELFTLLTREVPGKAVVELLKTTRREYGTGEIPFDTVRGRLARELHVDIDTVIRTWLTSRHEHYYRVRDFHNTLYQVGTEKNQWGQVIPVFYSEVTGKIMNRGKEGGIVVFEFSDRLANRSRNIPFYLAPGEVREFRIVSDIQFVWLNTGLSANRPQRLSPESQKVVTDEGGGMTPCIEWKPASPASLAAPSGEITVDNEDPGVELHDADLTWLQRLIKERPPVTSFPACKEATRWTPVVDVYCHGDSIRGAYCKRGGNGTSTVTWRTVLPESGRYRVMGLAYRMSWMEFWVRDIVYYYTVCGEGWEEPVEVEVNMDVALGQETSDWVTLGEFDFEAGEASITLSDKEASGRRDVKIVADAVKWIKIKE